MVSLRQRIYELTIQDLAIDGLDIEFKIERNLDQTQNTAEVLVYNLASDHRKHLQSVTTGCVVKLSAGTADTGLALIFLGKLREITNLRNGPDWETRVSSGDGDGKDRPINFSLGPNAKLVAVIKKTIRELGIGIGNALQAIQAISLGPGLGDAFREGVVISGRGDKQLDRLFESAGLEWSIQNGELQVLKRGRPLNAPAALVTQATGMIGSPELGTATAAGGGKRPIVKFRTLLRADIYPGRQVKIESDAINGYFRVERAAYLGQAPAGNDWYTDCDARPIT